MNKELRDKLQSYVLAAIVGTCLAMLTGCGAGGFTPPPVPVSIFLTPASSTVRVGTRQPFYAIVEGSTNTAVTWQVNGVTGGTTANGLIDSNGVYTAPSTLPTPASVTITAIAAVDATKSASASVTVVVAITVLPALVALNLNTAQCPVSQQFSAPVTGSSNTSVDWLVNGIPPGDPNTSFGTITTDGLYTAPGAIPAPPVFNVTAVSQAQPTQSASASVSVSAGGALVDQAAEIAPIQLGTSGGNAQDQSAHACCSGTLGALVMRNGDQFVLSNNHVLAREDQARPGESIVQPGLADSSCQAGNTVANFTQAVKLLNVNHTAVADAALAKVVAGEVDPSGAILQLGALSCTDPASNSGAQAQPAPPASTVVAPAVGMAVAKSGRTTGLTCGTVSAIAADFQVQYSNSCGSSAGFVVSFHNQVAIETPAFAGPGDSGSLIVNSETSEPTALLFGGDSASGLTIANPIQDVLNALPDPSNQALPTIVGGSTHPVEACVGQSSPSQSRQNPLAPLLRPSQAAMTRAKAVKSEHAAVLESDPAVLGVGVGAGDNPGEAAIIVFVDRGKAHRYIPANLDGVAVKVRTIGPLRAFAGGGCTGPPRAQAVSLR